MNKKIHIPRYADFVSPVSQAAIDRIEGTPDSRRVCEMVAEKTDTVILGYSRGKDTIAACLMLKKYFKRIICVLAQAAPQGTLGFVERSIAYQEAALGITVERHYTDYLCNDITKMLYQRIEDEDWIDELSTWEYAYDTHALAVLVAKKFRVPHAWSAWGLSWKDSVFRSSFSVLRAGYAEERQLFYPICDWDKTLILKTVEDAGIKLAEDYNIAPRSFNETCHGGNFVQLRDTYPADYQRVIELYPLVQASEARLEFRDQHFAPLIAAKRAKQQAEREAKKAANPKATKEPKAAS